MERIRAEKQQMVKDGKLKPKDIKNDTVIFKGDDNLHYEQYADGTVKCIEDEIPFDVPEGWEWCRLTSICSLISDIDHKMPKAVDDGVLFLSAKDLLNDGTINYSDNIKMISEEDFLRLSKKALPQKNDIIYSRIGACLGKARVVTKDILFLVSYSCCIIRPVVIDSIFLATILDGNFVLDQAKKGTQSVGVPDLGMASIKQFLVPIPPLAEQQRIDEQLQSALNIVQQISIECDNLGLIITQTKSKILDLAIRGKLVPQDPNDEPASVLLERIKSEKEELIKQGKIKRDKKESVIFKGDDNSYYEKIGDKVTCIDGEIPFEVPDNWQLCRFYTIYNLISGRDLKVTEYNDKRNGVPYITGASNFSTNGISLIRWTHVPQVTTELGDILLTCKGTIGEIAINSFGTAHIARQIMAIRSNYSLNANYMSLCIRYYVDDLRKRAKGLIPGISRDDVLNLILPLPPLLEQNRIVDVINRIFNIGIEIEKSLS